MIKTKDIIKKEEKEMALFNKHKNLLLIAKYLDCDYCIYQQHLFEIALKLKYTVYNNHYKQEVYYTVNSLYKAILELLETDFITRDYANLYSGGKSTGYVIRLLPKAIKLLDSTDIYFKKRSTNLFNHLVLLKGKSLIDMLDFYIYYANKKNIDTRNVLQMISERYIYNTFLGDKQKYYNCINSIKTAQTEKDKDTFKNATDTQINNIKTINLKSFTSLNYVIKEEENRNIKNMLRRETLYKLATKKFIYFVGKENNDFIFVVLDPSTNKTEKDFIDNYISIFNYTYSYLINTRTDFNVKICFYFSSDYTKKNFELALTGKNKELASYINLRLVKTIDLKANFIYNTINVVNDFGQSNIKKDKKDIPLSKKYPIKNFEMITSKKKAEEIKPIKYKNMVISDDDEDELI